AERIDAVFGLERGDAQVGSARESCAEPATHRENQDRYHSASLWARTCRAAACGSLSRERVMASRTRHVASDGPTVGFRRSHIQSKCRARPRVEPWEQTRPHTR